jgi:catechol 2,3-dioxygenase-like lactoylglutathione lyase family enzyme
MPLASRGVRHVHLLVSDQARSIAFYGAAFGMEVAFTDGSIAFLRSPGCDDDLALHQAETEAERARVGLSGGIEHFGISVSDRSRLDEVIALVEAAGGTLVHRGEHAPGVPCAYVADPDGYQIEL